jgi:type IV secretory pathway protease TraF
MIGRLCSAALALAACTALAAAGHRNGAPQLIWNTTASAPEGLYALRPGGRPGVGEWIAAAPPPELATWLDRRGYLPDGALLIKQIAATAPNVVCRQGVSILIDGRLRARAEAADRQGRALSAWRGCRRLAGHDVFVLNAAEGSLDSRYFGPLPSSAIRGRVVPLLTWERRHET